MANRNLNKLFMSLWQEEKLIIEIRTVVLIVNLRQTKEYLIEQKALKMKLRRKCEFIRKETIYMS